MDSSERERDFYREQCDLLGAQILDLQEQLRYVQREAREYRIAETLIREGYRLLAHPEITLTEISERFLHIVLDSVHVDLAAFLQYLPDQAVFVIDHSLGFSASTPPAFTLPSLPETFLFANANTPSDAVLDSLHQALGVPYLAWSFDRWTKLALVLGNMTEDQHLHRAFGPQSRDLVGVALDVYVEITQRKAVEDALARERDLLHALMDNVPDWIFFKDTKSRFVRNNKTHLQLLGVADQQEAVGKTDFDFFPPEFAQRYFDEEQAIIQSGQPMIAQEKQIPEQNGHLLWISETKIPLRDETGQVIGLVGTSRDITIRKEAEQHQLLLEMEKQRVQILAGFVQAASHEFRTPLSILSTCLYLLEKLDDPVKRSEKLKAAADQVAHISAMVEAMILLSRLDSDYALVIRPVNVNNILRVMAAAAQAVMAEKQQTLICQLANDLPYIPGDEYELHRALRELLNNALLFTPEGGTITIRTHAHQDYIAIEIRDTGIGISPEHLPRIFDRFFRVDQARTTRGVGLGLSIAKKIVQMHQGYIEVASTLGQGSVFRVWLPEERRASLSLTR
jgi:PAS domain S-box-containing protein